jgi:hypothetical protein
MALQDIQLTAGQRKVMDKLLLGLGTAKQRLEASQKAYNEEFEVVGEYGLQSAKELGIDATKDYVFDISQMKFIDRSTIEEPK